MVFKQYFSDLDYYVFIFFKLIIPFFSPSERTVRFCWYREARERERERGRSEHFQFREWSENREGKNTLHFRSILRINIYVQCTYVKQLNNAPQKDERRKNMGENTLHFHW